MKKIHPYDQSFGSFLLAALGLTVLAALLFLILRWLNVPAGELLDWLIAVVAFWWLTVVVTVPWNIYFQARSVLAGAALSAERGIALPAERLAYVRRWLPRALAVALGLHLCSALAFFGIAAAGVSPVGYFAAAAALLLTLLRPVLSAYEYVAKRLRSIDQEIRVPREDAVTLRSDLRSVEQNLRELHTRLDLDDPRSWAARHQAAIEHLVQRIDRQQVALDELRSSNIADHQRLAREAEQAIARISADARFLEQVRDIIRFVKEA
jgi:hypothetical protein